MKRIVICLFLVYVTMARGNEIGSVLDIAMQNYIKSFRDKKYAPILNQKVVVKYKKVWIWGEVVAIYGKICWIGVQTIHTNHVISRGIIKRYLIKDVYDLDNK